MLKGATLSEEDAKKKIEDLGIELQDFVYLKIVNGGAIKCSEEDLQKIKDSGLMSDIREAPLRRLV